MSWKDRLREPRQARCRRLLRLLLIAPAVLLASCTEPDLEPLDVSMVPSSGHPPYEAVVRVIGAGPGHYTLLTPDETLTQRDSSFSVTVDRMNWTASVAWDGDAGDRRIGEITAGTVNRAPIIGAPRLAPYNEWRLRPRERTLIDFSYREGFMGQGTTGIRDPDGDAWRIESLTIQCSLKDHPDSIFRSPLEGDLFHATWQGHVVDNACIVYPCYTSDEGPGGLPYPPRGMTEEGYPHDPYREHNLYLGVAFPSQTAYLTITTVDSLGARATETFTLPVSALPFDEGD